MTRALTGVAILLAAFAGSIAMTGGARFSFPGVNIAMTDPYRPLGLAMVLLVARAAIGGPAGVWADIVSFRRAVSTRRATIALIVATVAIGILEGSAVAGGADSYGYISQADLWLTGALTTAQPDAAQAPWPDAQWTFAPLGYIPSPSRQGIVPMYSPGFPLLLAAFKFVAGHCAIGWVVPMMAGVLIAATVAIGRTVASDQIGFAAAWLLATSPVFLYMLTSPMSDVPAAAFWALAAYGCLAGSRTGAVLGGIAAAMAVLVRPNLAHVALMMALWMAVRDVRFARRPLAMVRPLFFLLPVVAAGLAIASLNGHLYGAPTNSGYGKVSEIFRAGYFARNVVNYTKWMAESQTPLALAGLVAICVPWSRVMPARPGLRDKGLLAVLSMPIIATYLFYMNFDVWWYLRFLLPMWMAMCIGTAYLITGRSGRSFNAIGIAILAGLGAYGVWYAHREGAFDIRRNEQRYIRIGRLVRDTTEPNAVIITLQHSGSTRYYGGRTTLRYDVLSGEWLDRAIGWLRDSGFHPYLLLDMPEHEPFKEKFAGTNAAGQVDMAIVFEYRDRYNNSTFLYDPLRPSKLLSAPIVVAAPRYEPRVCTPPVTAPAIFSMERAER